MSNRELFVTSSNIYIQIHEVLLTSTYAAVILINRGIFLVGNWHAIDFKKVTTVTITADIKDITAKVF